MKKRSFTLIEVVVSLGLVSLLLGTLFYWYHTLARQKENYKTLKAPLLEERYAGQRLLKILPKADTPFFTSDNSLVFLFDRGPYHIPQLSGTVLARLYHDRESASLCLGIWPLPTRLDPPRTPTETHILLDQVESCAFEFYYPSDPFRKVDPQEVGHSHPRAGWQTEWYRTYNVMPALVKVAITRADQPGLKAHVVEWLFDFPVRIIYPGNAA